MKLKFGFLLTSIIILIFACSKDNGISLEPGENEIIATNGLLNERPVCIDSNATGPIACNFEANPFDLTDEEIDAATQGLTDELKRLYLAELEKAKKDYEPYCSYGYEPGTRCPEDPLFMCTNETDTVLIYDISRSCTAEITILDTFAFDSVAAVMEAQLDSIEQATYSDPSFFYTAIYASGTISDSIGLLFVSYNADVDYRQYDDETNLMLLIDDGASLELVSAAVAIADSLNAVDYSGNTALYYAVERGDSAIVSLLLDKGISVTIGASEITNAVLNLSNSDVILGVLTAKGFVLAFEEGLLGMIQSGETTEALYYINNGGDLTVTDASGDHALHYAVEYQRTEILKALIEKLGTVVVFGGKGYSPLNTAVEEIDTDMLEILLQTGVNPDTTLSNERPLETATKGNYEAAAEMLLDYGAEPTYVGGTDGESNPFGYAVQYGMVNVMRRMINAGVNINSPGSGALVPLSILFASSYLTSAEKLEFFESFLGNGAAPTAANGDTSAILSEIFGQIEAYRDDYINIIVDKGGVHPDTPIEGYDNHMLHEIVGISDSSAVEYLLTKGATVDLKTKLGYTALYKAISLSADPSIIDLLSKSGALSTNAISYSNDMPIWKYAIQEGLKEAIEFFLRDSLDPDITDENGEYAFIISLLNSNDEIPLLLINAGADILVKDSTGRNALTISLSLNKSEMADTLVTRGFDVSADSNQALFEMLEIPEFEEAQWLIEKGADLEIPTENGLTPLAFHVSRSDDTDMLLAFIDAGADINAVSDSGQTVLDIAQARPASTEMILMLQGAGAKTAVELGLSSSADTLTSSSSIADSLSSSLISSSSIADTLSSSMDTILSSSSLMDTLSSSVSDTLSSSSLMDTLSSSVADTLSSSSAPTDTLSFLKVEGLGELLML